MDGRVLGSYKLVRQLAVGGMAEIYVATTTGVAGFEKQLALKVIHPNFSADPEFMRMLVDEAKLAVQLQHGNIVQTYDLGRLDDTYYVVMELIDGVDLFKILKQTALEDRYVPFEMAAYVAHEVASGLDYAHRKRDADGRLLKLVHRDISPQNILVSFAGQVKIVDFGIAKAKRAGREKTAAGVIKGKYYYMSPEQAWGDPLDGRSDIFSTGILLHEMIAGEMLYYEEDFERLLDRVRKAEVAPPSARREGVPASLDAIVMKALRRKPGDRYQTGGELAVALAEWLRENAPEFTAPRLGQFVQRLFGEKDQPKQRMPEERTGQIVSSVSLVDEHSLIFKLADLKPDGSRRSGEETPAMELRSVASSLLQLEPQTGQSSLLELEASTGQSALLPIEPQTGLSSLLELEPQTGRALPLDPPTGVTALKPARAAIGAAGSGSIADRGRLTGPAEPGFAEGERTEVDRPLPRRRDLIDEDPDDPDDGPPDEARHGPPVRVAATPLLGLDEADEEHTELQHRPPAAARPSSVALASKRAAEPVEPARGAARSGLPGVRSAPAGSSPRAAPSAPAPRPVDPVAANQHPEPDEPDEADDPSSVDAPTGQWRFGASLPSPAAGPARAAARPRPAPLPPDPRANPPAAAAPAPTARPLEVPLGRPRPSGLAAAPAPDPRLAPPVIAPVPGPPARTPPVVAPTPSRPPTATVTNPAPLPGGAPGPVMRGSPWVPLSSPVMPSTSAPGTGPTPIEEPTRLPRRRGLHYGWVVFAASVALVVAGLIALLVAPVVPTRGAIEIASLPAGAAVRLDGKPTSGLTPLRIDDVDLRVPHALAITLAGHETAERQLEFLPGQREAVYHVVLAPVVGTARIESSPPGAEVLLNGRFRGETPLDVGDLPATEDLAVELRLRGYRVERRQVPWLGRRHLDVSARLDRGR